MSPSSSPAVEIEVDNRVVRVSNPDRVYFPESGATKLDLVEYYLVRRRRHRQRPVRAAVHAAPVPQGAGRRQGAPEAAPGRRAALGRDGPAALPALEPHRRRAVRHRARQRDLGGADVDRRVPPLEQPPRGHREARRVADRPRPRAAVGLRAGPAGRPRRPRGARRARRRSASPRPAAARGCTSTSGSRPTTASRRYAAPRWRSPARWSGGHPTT